MNKNLSLSVILPIYNEEYNLKKVIEDASSFLQNQRIFKQHEIIAVDDGSNDKTSEILKILAGNIPHLKVLIHHRNLGYGKALMSGMRVSQYPLVLFMDGDGQFSIKEINRIMIDSDDFDIIIGYRHRRKDNLFRIIFGRLYNFLVFLLFGLKFKDINCGFKLLKKEIIDSIDIHSRNGVFYTEILLKAKINGYKIRQVPIEHFPRLRGKEKGLSIKVIFNSIIDLIMLKYLLSSNKSTVRNEGV